MPEANDVRTKLLTTAAVLFKRQGYSATGLTQLLTESQTPKGSFYFYFPQGKEQLAAASVHLAGADFAGVMEKILSKESLPEQALLRFSKALGRWLEKSGYIDGCPITTVCLEMTPQSEMITETVNQAFQSWQLLWSLYLERSGFGAPQAQSLATTVLSALEGAFIFSRAEKSTRPFDLVAASLAPLLRTPSTSEQGREQRSETT
jgi:TetR/AcrR family transcriptional regulator, lmrAB and yxaGH operons repressor